MSHLFSPYTLKSVTFRNRVAVSPMSQYRAIDGVANDWHLVHLGRFAMGGAGLVFAEATAVTREGRRTHGDLGLWSDDQIAPLARIADFLAAEGAVPGVQLGHAGRKSSERRPGTAKRPWMRKTRRRAARRRGRRWVHPPSPTPKAGQRRMR